MKDADNEFRSLLADVIRRCRQIHGKDRKQIALELNDRLGRVATDQQGNPSRRSVTESMLNDFTRNIQPGRESHFPAAWVPAICEVLENDELARHLLPERLQGVIALGEQVLQSRSMLERAGAELAKLREYGPRKRKAKRS